MPIARPWTRSTQCLTLRESVETLLNIHTSKSPNGEIEIRESVRLADLPSESHDRYQAAWRTLSEARQRSMF